MQNNPITLITLLLLTTFSTLKAQNLAFGVTGNAGLSKMVINSQFLSSLEAQFAFSGNGGLFLEKSITEKHAIGLELLWVQIQGREGRNDYEIAGMDDDGEFEVIGLGSNEENFQASYLALPIYGRYQVGKFGLKVGFQTMLFLNATSDFKIENNFFDGTSILEEQSETAIDFRAIDLGPTVGLDFSVHTKLRLRLNYYHGARDIILDGTPFLERRNRQVSAGLQYTLLD